LHWGVEAVAVAVAVAAEEAAGSVVAALEWAVVVALEWVAAACRGPRRR
jgi:hypothetical protein